MVRYDDGSGDQLRRIIDVGVVRLLVSLVMKLLLSGMEVDGGLTNRGLAMIRMMYRRRMERVGTNGAAASASRGGRGRRRFVVAPFGHPKIFQLLEDVRIRSVELVGVARGESDQVAVSGL